MSAGEFQFLAFQRVSALEERFYDFLWLAVESARNFGGDIGS